MRSPLSLLGGLALFVSVGCPNAAEPAANSGIAPVHTQSVYRFRGVGGSEHWFLVTHVPTDAILYTVRTRLGEQDVADPVEKQRFPLAPAGVLPAGEDGTLRLGDRDWPARIVTVGTRTTLTARFEGRPAFPGVLKIQEDGRTVWELIAIDPSAGVSAGE